MRFELPKLPYAFDALEPALSRRTIGAHYGNYHATRVSRLNELVQDTPLGQLDLLGIMAATASDLAHRAVFFNAVQVWNHAFLWNSMMPKGGGSPKGPLASAIHERFGDMNALRSRFLDATERFRSGWLWLALWQGRLQVVRTADADNPLVHGMVPLLTCDLCEHAYCLDYLDRPVDYVKRFLDHLVNWDQAELQFAQALCQSDPLRFSSRRADRASDMERSTITSARSPLTQMSP
jgi:Fe-Mn family superoxide dismutase